MHKPKKTKSNWYDQLFFKWLYGVKRPSSKKKVSLTAEEQKELVRLNGGWDEDKLFIPMMTKREAMLRYASTWKAIWFFCLPTIILMVVQGLYNILDKSLSLIFVTPNAIKNPLYLQYMVGDEHRSILLQSLNDTKGILNSHEIFINTLKQYFQLNDQQAETIFDYFKIDNGIHFTDSTNGPLQLLNFVQDNNISITSAKMKEYINVSTQYTVQSYNIVLSFTQILAIGAGMHYSSEFGRRNKEKLKEIAGNGLIYAFLGSIIIGIVLFALSYRPWGQVLIATQMGHNRNLIVEELAWKDVQPLIYGISAIFLAFMSMNMLRSEGKMIHIMIMTITSLGIKFLTSILLMKYTNLELTAAQLGTIFSFLYQFIYCLIVMFFSKVTYSNFSFHDLFHLRLQNLTYALKAGFPNFINYFAFVVNGYLVTSLVIRLPASKSGPSTAANGGVSILQQLISSITPWNDFILSAVVGLNQGVRTMIAYNDGAGKNHRILEILKRSSWLMLGWFAFILVLVFAIGPYMLQLFAFPSAYAKYGNEFYWYLILFFMFYPLACFTYIDLGLFQGKGRTVAATIASSLRSLVIFVPLTLIGFFVAKGANNPLWYFFFIGLTDGISALILIPMLIGFYYQQKATHQLQDKSDDKMTLASYNKFLVKYGESKTQQKQAQTSYEAIVASLTKAHFRK